MNFRIAEIAAFTAYMHILHVYKCGWLRSANSFKEVGKVEGNITVSKSNSIL